MNQGISVLNVQALCTFLAELNTLTFETGIFLLGSSFIQLKDTEFKFEIKWNSANKEYYLTKYKE